MMIKPIITIYNNEGVVLLNIITDKYDINNIVNEVKDKMKRYNISMVIIKQGDDLIEILI